MVQTDPSHPRTKRVPLTIALAKEEAKEEEKEEEKEEVTCYGVEGNQGKVREGESEA